MHRWEGRVAVVTGASSGIGEAIAEELVKQGLIVVGIARRVDRIQELAKGLHGAKGKLLAVKADIYNEQEVLDAFAWIEKNTNGIDVLINNAGVAEADTLLGGSTEAWKRILDLNVIGLSICSREAVKSMKKKGSEDGIIININSIASRKVHARYSMYTASKFAVTALSEALYKELAASGSRIRVTNLSPGAVITEMLLKATQDLPLDRAFGDDYKSVILQPSDIAQAVVFILSVESRVFIPELTIQQNFEFIS